MFNFSSGVGETVIRFGNGQFCSAVWTEIEVIGEKVVAASKGTAFHVDTLFVVGFRCIRRSLRSRP